MDAEQHAYMNKRVTALRSEMQELVKYGRSSRHYEEHLAKLEGIARVTRERLEQARLQLVLEV